MLALKMRQRCLVLRNSLTCCLTMTYRLLLSVFILLSFQTVAADITLSHYLGNEKSLTKVTLATSNQWHELNATDFSLPVGKHWLRVELGANSKSQNSAHLIVFGDHNIDDISAYKNKGGVGFEAISVDTTFDLQHHLMVSLPRYSTETVYLLISVHEESDYAIKRFTHQDFRHYLTSHYIEFGFFIGVLAAYAIAIACIFLSTKRRPLAYLTFYFGLQALGVAALSGVNLGKIVGLSPSISVTFIFVASSILILAFCAEVFSLKQQHRKLLVIYRLTGTAMVCYLAVCWFLSHAVQWYAIPTIGILTLTLVTMLAVHLWRSQNEMARFFATVVVLQYVFKIIHIYLFGLDKLSADFYAIDCIVTGMCIIGLLAYQSNLDNIEKERAQKEALDYATQKRQAQEELLAVQEEAQEQLENAVQERTFELNIALQELEDANQELEKKNTIDELTGLFNRRYYDQKIQAEFRRSRRNLTPLSIVVVDIDHFKNINDTHGHSIGDMCIQQLAVLIKSSLRRSGDIGCRYGGEEFCLILPETEQDGAMSLADDLRATVNEHPFHFPNIELSITISCGVSTYMQQENVEAIDVFNAADKALYQAKKAGRNQVSSVEISVPDAQPEEE